jgi:nickel-dependent lactate racemase
LIVRIRLDYGKSGLIAELPDKNLIGVLGIKAAPPIKNASGAVTSALLNPIGATPLPALAAVKKSACIVICDITRPVPNKILLPPVLRILEESEITQDAITILIATGTHRPNVGSELEKLVGAEIASKYRVINHHCKCDDEQVSLGVSPGGVPVYLDRAYCNAELRITIGLIEPHFMAGYSGGRKLIMPGIAGFETIQNWHCPRFLESPLAAAGVVEGNPVHEESLAIAKMCRPDVILDVTLDEDNRITGIFAGDLEQAWMEGAQFAAKHVKAEIAQTADIVVTTCAGAPLDATYYQAVKGMVGAMPAVKPGGTIIIAAECAEGLGSPDFADLLLNTKDLDVFVRHISQPGVFVREEWEVEELAKAVNHANITCVTTGIAAETLAQCFVTPARTVEEAVDIALKRHGEDATILAIPRGPYVIPQQVLI